MHALLKSHVYAPLLTLYKFKYNISITHRYKVGFKLKELLDFLIKLKNLLKITLKLPGIHNIETLLLLAPFILAFDPYLKNWFIN